MLIIIPLIILAFLVSSVIIGSAGGRDKRAGIRSEIEKLKGRKEELSSEIASLKKQISDSFKKSKHLRNIS